MMSMWCWSSQKSFFLWICSVSLLHCSNTSVFFFFDETVLGIFSLSALILLPTLLPLSATDNSLKNSRNATDTTSNGTFSQLDNLSMANITVSSKHTHNFNSFIQIHRSFLILFFLFLTEKEFKAVGVPRSSLLDICGHILHVMESLQARRCVESRSSDV